ncbi:MAG: nucleotidyltransferase [Clostridia bacterium]|nr:nucleotidyltransferase [Clostridia bacterium]
MKTAGIICEYNPFHTGHKYHIDHIKQEFDAVVCIMSGSFVQRGGVAIYDKWSRARSALENGADLVIELPVKYALSSAEGFAEGGVRILDATGVIDALCFGSESGDILELTTCAKALLSESPEVSQKIKVLMNEGLPYAKARAIAYEGILDANLLAQPNNILAIEYIKAILKSKSNLRPITIKRKGAGYHDEEVIDGFASATLLREKIRSGEDVSTFTPYDLLASVTYDVNRLTNAFKYKLRTEGESAFDGIADMEPGLANRFLNEIDRDSIASIVDAVKTKRYAHTRLRRIVAKVLLGLTEDTKAPDYIRVLGMSTKGKELLSQMREKASFPIVNKVADFKDESILPDILATDLAALCADSPVPMGRDFTTSPIIIE